MTCPNCRHTLSPGEIFCSKCGCRITPEMRTGAQKAVQKNSALQRSVSADRKNTVLIICAVALILAVLAAGLFMITRVIGSFGETETELQYTVEAEDSPSTDVLREAWENKVAQAAEADPPAEETSAEEEPLIIPVPEAPETDPLPEPEPEPEPDVGEYIFPDSDSRFLSEEEVRSKTAAELRIARNEIYARHGRMFTSEDLDAHFRATSWYEPRYTAEEFDSFGASVLNSYESANIDLILETESRYGS